MPQSEPVTILLVSDIAEEIKLVTLSFRGFFQGCRVDAVYSLDEALQWAPRTPWRIILLDERLLVQRDTPIIPELKRLAPLATIVLQTERSDATAALNALQAGADFLLYKKSPAFLTELVLYAKDALEKQDLRTSLERVQERHNRLVETLGDVLYELDAEGRFVYVSPSVTALLGYTPDELIGAHYSTIVPPDRVDRARHRFDDRRTGTRASRQIELELVPKPPRAQVPARLVRVGLSAKGLYDSRRRFLGTLGLLRDLSQFHQREDAIRAFERRLQETDRLVAMAQHLSTLSSNLQAPLAAVLSHAQRLLGAVREVRLDQQIESLVHHAAEAARRGEELAQTVQETGIRQETLNDVLDGILAATTPPLLDTDRIERRYAPNLPPLTGPRELIQRFLRTLLLQVLRYVDTIGTRHRLSLTTTPLGPGSRPWDSSPTLFPPALPTEIEIAIEETDVVATGPALESQEATDLVEMYALVRQLGGHLDFLVPAGQLLSIKCRLPVRPPEEAIPVPPTGPVSPAPLPVEPPLLPFTPAPPTKPGGAPPPVSALPDRRIAQRLPVHIPARLTIGNGIREGTITHLGPGGATIVVEGTLPSLEGQPAYVALKTAVGMLEVQATAHDRGEYPRQKRTDPVRSLIAFRFTSTSEAEQKILASLIQEARDRAFSLSVEALLPLPDQTTEWRPPGFEKDLRGTDHREAVRVRVALPVRIETSAQDAAQRPLGLVVNFSRGGACLQAKRLPGVPGELVVLHFSATGPHDRPRVHEPEAPEATLTARIIWTATDPTVPSELRPAVAEPGQRVGLRFVQLTPFAEREINRVVIQHVGSSMDLEGIASRSPIVSVRRECRNARQQLIAVTDDHARHQISPSTPIVVIVPGFGRTQTDYLPLAYFLAANRLRVLRYDHSNHVGQSDGDVLQVTLRGMQVDLQNVLEFVRTTWPTAPLTILAEDIAARVALKVLSQGSGNDRLLIVNPVLDLRLALSTTYGRDVLADHEHGLRRGVVNLWGLNVNLDQFLSDAIAGTYADVSTVAADWATYSIPPVIYRIDDKDRPDDSLFGPFDSSLNALGQAPAVIPLRTDVALASGIGDDRHAGTFQTILKQISTVPPGERQPPDIREAPPRDIRRQQELERERLRLRHHVSQATRNALWVAHLAQLSQLGNLHEYSLLREELYRRLLPLEPGMSILDIGCGQGDLARTVLTNRAYQLAHLSGPPGPPLRYVGLCPSRESLDRADQQIQTYLRELAAVFGTRLPATPCIDTQWVQSEWETLVLFEQGSFARILFQLSLCFSSSPLQSLRQALTLLSPKGILVVTCFQPHTDLSRWFRRQLRKLGQSEFGPSHQVTLHYLGRVREAVRHGLLHSYERLELAQLLTHAGAHPLRIQPVLDGQLLLAVALKGNSAG